MQRGRAFLAFAALLVSSWVIAQTPVGTAFTYQGRLTEAEAPANGSYDLEFKLFDAASGGSQVGSTVTLGSVGVTNGLFTASLDFGTGVFAGNRRWLQMGVRPGGTGGAFTTLVPRQELTAGPNAIFALAAASATTVAGLACSDGQVLKWSGTSWTCGTDIDTNSGGTVQTISTGAGLTGGPISVTGTVSVATGGITSEMIANGAVGLAQINTAEVQPRITGICQPGDYLRGINPDGSVVCEPAGPRTVITTVDGEGPGDDVGEYTSIAIGADGLPVISYYDAIARTLKVAHCGNAACSTGAPLGAQNTITTVDNQGPTKNVGTYTSIAIGTDGLPVISYRDATDDALKVAHCGNAACSAGNTLTTVDDPANLVGRDTSIAIGADGLPVISYRDMSALALKVAKCSNAACTGASTITTVDDPANNVGLHTSIAIGDDGLPVISYQDATAYALKVVKCVNAACTGASTITTVDDPAERVGEYTSIAIGDDGLPVVSYRDATAFALKVAKCANAACTGVSTITTVDDPANNVGEYTSIAIGDDGPPVISYSDSTARALKVAKCANAACTGVSTITTVDDPANFVGRYTSIAIGADRLPVISYRDYTGGWGALKVAHCVTRSCQ
jgi:hypothetical protein